jgi:hypothetical protein
MDLQFDPMVPAFLLLQLLLFRIALLYKETLVKHAIQVFLSKTVDAARFQDFAMDQILRLELALDALLDIL